MKLSRADVEWLLAAHQNGYGPVRDENHASAKNWTYVVLI